MEETFEYFFKIVLVGDCDVGKSQILFRLSENVWNSTPIGVAFKSRTIELDGKIVTLQIWDTAGAQRFQTIRTLHYIGAKGIMLIYDTCNAKSFDSIAGYHKEIKKHAPRDVEIMLLGNNCHMKDKRQVNKETGERYAAEHGMKFMEVSALAGINIEEAFSTIARTIKDTNEGATGSDECVQEDGSDELRTENACVVQ